MKMRLSSEKFDLPETCEFDLNLNELDCDEYGINTDHLKNMLVKENIMKHHSDDQNKNKKGNPLFDLLSFSNSEGSQLNSVEVRMHMYHNIKVGTIKVKPKERKVIQRKFLE